MCRRPSEPDRLLGLCVEHLGMAEFVVLFGALYAALVVAKAVAW